MNIALIDADRINPEPLRNRARDLVASILELLQSNENIVEVFCDLERVLVDPNVLGVFQMPPSVGQCGEVAPAQGVVVSDLFHSTSDG